MDILCGLDFTEAGGQACQIAAQLALRLGDRLVLAHALDSAAQESSAPQKTRAEIQAELQQRATSLQTTGIDVVAHVLEGVPDQTLIELADSVAPRLMVLGTGYKQGIGRDFAGSMAEQVARRAHYPVLIVGEQPGHVAHWVIGNRPLRVLLAMDDSLASSAAIAWVKELRTRLPVDLNIVHFYFPPDEHLRRGLPPAVAAPGGLADSVESGEDTMRQTLQNELRARVGDMPGEGSYTVNVYANWVSVSERLAGELQENPADVLILGAHRRSVFEQLGEDSVIVQMLHSTPTPLMCVPGGEPPPPAERRLPVLQTVLAACDLSPTSQNVAAYYAYAVLRGRGGKVHLCHVTDDPGQVPAVKSALDALISAQESVYGITTEVHVLVGSATGQTLAELAESLPVDLICLGTHGRSAFSQALTGSTANEVNKHTNKPVLLVRDDLPF
jgi:nucleotide-binding universal stress UspA family protein